MFELWRATRERNEGADSELVSTTATPSLRETLHCDRIVGREKAMVRSRIFPASALSEEASLLLPRPQCFPLLLSLTHTHARARSRSLGLGCGD